MSQHDDPLKDDFDDDTWHQPEEGPPTIRPGDSTGPEAPDEGPPPEPGVESAPHTVAGGDTSIPPPSTSAGRDSGDSGDSGESLPRPDELLSDEWDRLPPPSIAPGQVVFGKYRLEKKLGKGGMGEVWLVENLPLQKESALKLIDPKYAQDEKGWRRFEREARVMAKITHPNAVAVHDFRRTQSMAYIEMEYVRGRSLEQYLKEHRGPVTLEWAARLLDQLCSVLEAAHGYVDRKTGKSRPIIHRDLKPSNLMLDEDRPEGQDLKVLDFGIAKMVQEEGSPELTGQGEFLGTPHYMSPEQIRGGVGKDGRGDIDGRSDLYSVGILLYQLLTGSLPFRAKSNMEILVAHLHQDPVPMREANPRAKLPPQVERLVMSCLEKEPDLRPRSARELAERFRAATGKLPPGSGPRAGRSPAVRLVALSLAAAVALTLGGLGLRKLMGVGSSGRTEVETPKTTATPEKDEPVTKGLVGHSAALKSLLAQGYEPMGLEQLETEAQRRGLSLGSFPVDRRAEAPGLIDTRRHRTVYYAFEHDIYLPLGYTPESSNDLVDFFPRVLVRSDKVRFVRISGGRYHRGDFRQHAPIDDLQGNVCKPHEVEVSGFYLQETEVTNREVERFLQLNADIKLTRWKEIRSLLINDLKKPVDEVSASPAVCIDREIAQKYAQSVSGSLPTEAEWEYAARSRGQNQTTARRTVSTRKGEPRAHLMSGAATDPFPLPVKSFVGEDETDQEVFDMTGNVREWCLDRYRPYDELLRESRDPVLRDPGLGQETATVDLAAKYVVKGGSSLVNPEAAMTFQRDAAVGSSELNDLGFRVVLRCPAMLMPTAE
ncbi:MAG: bifunctional serine/threonine-protein kinase/formylglycine-generating enzyme family protein [Isosphaeraceae bacterium]